MPQRFCDSSLSISGLHHYFLKTSESWRGHRISRNDTVNAQHCLCLPLLFSHHILPYSYPHIEHTQPHSTAPSSHCPQFKIQEFWVTFRFVSSNIVSLVPEIWELKCCHYAPCHQTNNDETETKCSNKHSHSEVKRLGDVLFTKIHRAGYYAHSLSKDTVLNYALILVVGRNFVHWFHVCGAIP